MNNITIQILGQSGCIFYFPHATLYIDPYLSHSVQELDSPDIQRLLRIPMLPSDVHDADYVLITHEHIDHCDPHTLPTLSIASPQAKFIAPKPVIRILQTWNISQQRCTVAMEQQWVALTPELKVQAIPAAHPQIERDDEGYCRFIGYMLNYKEKLIYIAGDTGVHEELINSLKTFQKIDIAFLPVNEQNYFRTQRGIIGNMSVREAFLLAQEVNIQKVIPVHWDMFAINSVSPVEIQAVYDNMQPSFELLMQPTEIIL
ncbi:MBL fold metallo-hydrolase [Candidatus Albibeggiatoa sp. nov. NOAA]|uniref:MBL fold metallo-hydrolase n=1 Tax=Candidatus Albibeggiatoa sp. nov. NOAA TaxID=3162724 RepID=UPI0032FFBB50|nr:MBL fold metallo-hydrolase [Thiotrichaceae bacterium]